MDEKKILFVVHKTSQENYDACVKSIEELDVPLGYSYQIAAWSKGTNDADAIGEVYNKLLEENVAKYKIFIKDTVLFVNETMLKDMINIFQSDEHIGLIGTEGTTNIPDSLIFGDADKVYGGKYFLDNNKNVIEKRNLPINKEYAVAAIISSTFLAIQYSVKCVEQFVTENIIGEAQAIAFGRKGYKAVVPKQAVLWCLDVGNNIDVSQKEKEMLKEYVSRIVASEIDEETKKRLIKEQQGKPLLTIGIPTYNRSQYLSKCLKAIYEQIEDNPLVEVFVSDNDSSDDTATVVNAYKSFGNLTYYKQKENIGGDNNIDYLYKHAAGNYILVCGDDDYYNWGTVDLILKVISENKETAVIGLDWFDSNSHIKHGEGMDDFLLTTARTVTSISSVVLKTRYYRELQNKDKFRYTNLNQVYLQMAILQNHSDFAYVYGKNFQPKSGEAIYVASEGNDKKRGFCAVFIDQYFDILKFFLDKGLTIMAVKQEKLNLMNYYILNWLNAIASGSIQGGWKVDDNLAEIIEKHYKDEPYYKELLQHLAPYLKGN